jgi:ketosteroid isomerase-like protein
MRLGPRSSGRIVAAAALLLACACQKTTESVDPVPDPTAEAEVIKQAEIDWSKEMAQKNPDKMAAHFAAGAPIYLSGSPMIHGPLGVKAAMAKAFRDPAFRLEFTPDDVNVAKNGDMAWVTGSYEATATDPKTHKPRTVQGQYLTVYTRSVDCGDAAPAGTRAPGKCLGKWLVSADFAGDLPPQADDDGH